MSLCAVVVCVLVVERENVRIDCTLYIDTTIGLPSCEEGRLEVKEETRPKGLTAAAPGIVRWLYYMCATGSRPSYYWRSSLH